MRTTIRTAVALAALAACGTSLAQTLEARDINLDGTIDAYYDSVQNLTWLADATFAASQGVVSPYGVPGAMSLSQSQSFVAQLDVYSVTGWRLPVSFVPDLPALCNGGRGDVGACTGLIRLDSELSRLYDQVGLNNPFQNSANAFWTGNTYTPVQGGDHLYVQYFGFGGAGYRGVTDETEVPLLQAWAVHDGYVAAVPEPSTYAMMLAGLAVVCGVARRRAGRTAAT